MTRARIPIAPITVDAIKNWKPIEYLKLDNELTASYLETVAASDLTNEDALAVHKLSLFAVESCIREYERSIEVTP
jgi:hypothetical protein